MSVYDGVVTTLTSIEPPRRELLHAMAASLKPSYGWLRSNGETPAFIPAVQELRSTIVPAWMAGQPAHLAIQHATTMVVMLDLFESKLLSAYRGDRAMQRKAMNEQHPKALHIISLARKQAHGWEFTTTNGRTISA